jgi:hypothetical protein
MPSRRLHPMFDSSIVSLSSSLLIYSIVRFFKSVSSEVIRQFNQYAPHVLAPQKETAQTEPKFIVILWEVSPLRRGVKVSSGMGLPNAHAP